MTYPEIAQLDVEILVQEIFDEFQSNTSSGNWRLSGVDVRKDDPTNILSLDNLIIYYERVANDSAIMLKQELRKLGIIERTPIFYSTKDCKCLESTYHRKQHVDFQNMYEFLSKCECNFLYMWQ